MPSTSIKTLTLAFTASLALFNTVSARSLDSSPSSLFARGKPGINCEGSSNCGMISSGASVWKLRDGANQLPPGRTYAAGDQLACVDIKGLPGGLCASVCENTPIFVNSESTAGNPKTFNLAADVLDDLINHGCSQCGTAPTNRVGNHLSDGCISVNYVTSLCSSVNGPCL